MRRLERAFAAMEGEGGGDGFRTDAQQLPVGPLACRDGVAGVEGGGLVEVAADVDVIDQDRHPFIAGLRAGVRRHVPRQWPAGVIRRSPVPWSRPHWALCRPVATDGSLSRVSDDPGAQVYLHYDP